MSSLPKEIASVIKSLKLKYLARGKNGLELRDADIEAVNGLIDYYVAGSEAVRKRVVTATWDAEHSLNAYSVAMAVLAVRRNDPALVFRGLVALGIAGGGVDDYGTTYLALLGNSARKLQTNEDELFQQVIPLLPAKFMPELADCIHEYLKRTPRSRKLAMRCREKGKGETFNYVPRGK